MGLLKLHCGLPYDRIAEVATVRGIRRSDKPFPICDWESFSSGHRRENYEGNRSRTGVTHSLGRQTKQAQFHH